MDRRSWLWRRKSSEKSPGETESSGSLSSISERYSDDQDVLRASPASVSPNDTHSPEVSSKIVSRDVNETVKSLNEKLSAALLSISAKEDLVKQHARVAEEAVSGWEKAENEVVSLKQQLEATAKKNSALEDRIGHLDGALKECVRQLHQSREEHEKKHQDYLVKITKEWESQKFELETQVVELHAHLEARKAEATISGGHDLELMLQALEQENTYLKAELLSAFEDLQVQNLERELSIRAAETASKQHLDSIKKVAKLEAECRKLRALTKRSSPFKENKPLTSSVCAESITDSQSDCGERLFGVDIELNRSDSSASAVIVEHDQFKNDKVYTRNLTSSSGFDLMDDFLEMEKLAALPEAHHGASGPELVANVDPSIPKQNLPRADFEALQCKVDELEEKVEKMATEKQEMEKVLAETTVQLKFSCEQLTATEEKLVELQRQLNSANGSKHAYEVEVEVLESRKKELETQLEAANSENKKLHEKMRFLEGTSAKFAAKYQNMEALSLKKERLEEQLMSAHTKVQKLQEKVDILEGKIKEERALSARLEANCQKMEAVEAERMALESKLISAQLEREELQGKVSLLERELRVHRELSSDFAAKMETVEEEREELRYLLKAARTEAENLRGRTGKLEKDVEEERALSAQYISKVEALEAEKEALNSLLELAHSEVYKLRENMVILEKEQEVKTSLSSDLAAKNEHVLTLEARKEEVESQLNSAIMEVGELHRKVAVLEAEAEDQRALRSQFETAHNEIKELHEKVTFLEKEIIRERKLSADFESECQSLKDQLVRMKEEVERQWPARSTDGLNLKQEKDFAASAERLAECQNTIASMSRHLKSLLDFDSMLESEGMQLNDKENMATSLFLNDQDDNPRQPSAVSSPLTELVKRSSPGSSCIPTRSQ